MTAAPWVPEGADLAALAAAAPACRGCDLWAPATQVVFGVGPHDATAVLVGEQPGDQEDKRGEPFVGPAGSLLRRLMVEAGLDTERTYLTNAVKHFKFTERGKRRIHQKPARAEVVACGPWLDAELRALSPNVVALLGATAAQAVVGASATVGKLRGRAVEVKGIRPPVVVTIHPSALLRADGDEREAMEIGMLRDLELVARLQSGLA